MFKEKKIVISDIIYVNRITGNAAGSKTSFNTVGVDHNQLLFKLSGEAKITYAGTSVVEKENDVRFLPSASIYGFIPDYTAEVSKQGESINIAFKSDISLASEITVLSLGDLPNLKQLFVKLHRCWVSKRNGYYFRCVSLLYEILAVIFETDADDNKIISPALEYIDEHLTDTEINCDLLPRLCGVSHTYLNTLFKNKFGTSIKGYILSKKLNFACELLYSKEFSVTEVSELVGFSSPYYFSRIFKKYLGIPPSEYTKNAEAK